MTMFEKSETKYITKIVNLNSSDIKKINKILNSEDLYSFKALYTKYLKSLKLNKSKLNKIDLEEKINFLRSTFNYVFRNAQAIL